jgi:hypothetical protein
MLDSVALHRFAVGDRDEVLGFPVLVPVVDEEHLHAYVKDGFKGKVELSLADSQLVSNVRGRKVCLLCLYGADSEPDRQNAIQEYLSGRPLRVSGDNLLPLLLLEMAGAENGTAAAAARSG